MLFRVGEEAVAADPSLLDKSADADLAVVVDPIDGTITSLPDCRCSV